MTSPGLYLILPPFHPDPTMDTKNNTTSTRIRHSLATDTDQSPKNPYPVTVIFLSNAMEMQKDDQGQTQTNGITKQACCLHNQHAEQIAMLRKKTKSTSSNRALLHLHDPSLPFRATGALISLLSPLPLIIPL